jgi:hypothetical protein
VCGTERISPCKSLKRRAADMAVEYVRSPGEGWHEGSHAVCSSNGLLLVAVQNHGDSLMATLFPSSGRRRISLTIYAQRIVARLPVRM